MGNLQTLFLILTLILIGGCQLHVDPITSHLTDASGRFRFYHGVNTIFKQTPFHPTNENFDVFNSLGQSDMKKLSDLGFNAIRLNIVWEAFQPSQGKYNYTYLQQIKKITRKADQHNISVVLDAHQDLYSRKFCGYGFPDWAVNVISFPAPLKIHLQKDLNGYPLKQSCQKISSTKYHGTDDVMRFSHNFITNKNGLMDKFIKMWINVVSFFNEENNILGYDLINQPSGTDKNVNFYDFYGPGVNNNKYLLPFYKQLSSAIRNVDKNRFIFFQPSFQDYTGGFIQNPSGPSLINKDVLSYALYCPFTDQKNEPKSETKCKYFDLLRHQSRIANAKKLKSGSFITQFGGVLETVAGMKELNQILLTANVNWDNWFYWEYKRFSSYPPQFQKSFYFGNGSLQQKKVFALSAPYSYAICGTPVSQASTLNSYTLSLIPGSCGSSYTQISLNEDLYFKNGFTISFNPPCPNCVLQNYKKNHYQLIVSSDRLHQKLELRVAGYIS